jgi:cytochrome c553
MKATLRSYLNAKDTVRLASSLEQLAEKAPPGYADWRETALAAAKAARSGDLPTAKTECKHCHDKHRNRFRAERRTVALF